MKDIQLVNDSFQNVLRSVSLTLFFFLLATDFLININTSLM